METLTRKAAELAAKEFAWAKIREGLVVAERKGVPGWIRIDWQKPGQNQEIFSESFGYELSREETAEWQKERPCLGDWCMDCLNVELSANCEGCSFPTPRPSNFEEDV
jgi:hypothetical protein